MKKILFLATILLANISCQEEEINTQIEPSVPQSKNLQIVQITNQGEIIPINGTTTRSSVEGELALRFISESDYQSTITEISHMTAKERLEYVDNFISLQKLANEADMELDEIGAVATSEADFRKRYAQYVEKYSEKLITNKYDAAVTSPALPRPQPIIPSSFPTTTIAEKLNVLPPFVTFVTRLIATNLSFNSISLVILTLLLTAIID